MANAATHGRVARGRGRSAPLLMVIRVLIALGLAVDAYVHFILAPQYQQAYPDGMGGGTLFRIQAVAAILAGLYVLIRGSRLSYAIAALVALSAFAAVVLSVYIQLPQVGPIPAMYEPLWFFEKTLSAVAEGIAGVLAVVGFFLVPRKDTALR
ncbi:hypothetical protein ASH00_00780 [Arthrobacter sp. Soil782]|uniref:hypothetical protein n=1 Tax=Arthrobacter sp. Soil782 TaxID=1736410 RepID=UPI0006F1F56E|nr:hypothetical protein [Arthrobacter sp. Soil782]KRF08303.1 hypothetical protein ASH00_00780 [Arthrobacter sp. Soil782]